MSSPCNITIRNATRQAITTKVTRADQVESDGKPIDNQVIPAGEDVTCQVVAETAHHGELDISLVGGSAGDLLGTLELQSLKDPHEPFRGGDEPSTKVTPKQDTISLCAMGYRKSPGDADLRRINVLVVER